MNRILLTLFMTSMLSAGMAQGPLKTFKPKDTYPVPDFSIKAQKEIERRNVLLAKKNPSTKEKDELSALLQKHDETMESVWNIIGSECSWYCGGGNYAVRSSSSLSGKAYEAKQANDLNYQTAWVEGKDGDGVGEYIEYLFKNESPRITKIIVSNGYVKSEAAWKSNNRVKKLKVYMNGKPFGVLELKDTRDDQVFELGTLGRNKNGTDLSLRFEILEVYKGDKYNDTAITEIYFDGIDTH